MRMHISEFFSYCITLMCHIMIMYLVILLKKMHGILHDLNISLLSYRLVLSPFDYTQSADFADFSNSCRFKVSLPHVHLRRLNLPNLDIP